MEQARYEKKFTQTQQSTKTFFASVRQILSLSGMKKPLVSLGKIYFQNPQGWLLIRYTQPKGEYVLLRDDELFIQKKGKPLKIQPLKNEGGFMMLRRFFQEDAESWKKDFAVSMFKDAKDLIVMLTPKKRDKMQPLSIETRVNRETFSPQKIRLFFEGDNEIIYEFNQAQRNVAISPQLFDLPE
jgi:outer membrane lipoprotein-sorting protein